MKLPNPIVFRVLDALAPSVGARLLARFFFRPHRRPLRDWEQRLAQTATPVRLASGHQGLSWGEGPAVLLVHGWESRPTQLGAFIAPLVARGFRVIGFYAPAHGEHPERSLTVFEYAHFLRAVAREYGPLRGIIAHSMGAAATGFALNMGLAVERVVLISIPESVSTGARWLEAALELGARTRRRFRRLLEEKHFHAPLERLAVSEYASYYKTPALLLATEDDREVPAQDTRRLAAVWPNARLKVFADAGGHRRILRDKRTIAAAVEFVAAKAAAEPEVATPIREAKAA